MSVKRLKDCRALLDDDKLVRGIGAEEAPFTSYDFWKIFIGLSPLKTFNEDIIVVVFINFLTCFVYVGWLSTTRGVIKYCYYG